MKPSNRRAKVDSDELNEDSDNTEESLDDEEDVVEVDPTLELQKAR